MTELIINSQIQSINASKKFGDNNINFNFQKDGDKSISNNTLEQKVEEKLKKISEINIKKSIKQF